MIKCETVGMIEVSKNNPVLKSENAVANYSFITVDGDLYLIANTVSGDADCSVDTTFAAGEFLRGFLVKAWEGQKLVIDEKHITYASGKSYADIVAGTTILTVANDGTLEVANSTPQSGIYFKVTDKTMLTGKAVKAKVVVA